MRILYLIATLMVTLASLPLRAQEVVVYRGDCMPPGEEEATTHRAALRRLPSRKTDWDATKTYKQLVILVEFSDSLFQRGEGQTGEDVRLRYDRMFNENGYNERDGKGSVAEYFRDQSGGLFNMEADVFGPYAVGEKARPSSSKNYGWSAMSAALQQMIDQNPTHDFSQYDWNGDNHIEQVVFVLASLCGNQGGSSVGFLWPNTSTLTTVTTPDGKTISDYSASAELWLGKSKPSCGIGTICHEYAHSLGLPDIYPVSSTSDISIVVDEWDLMDGGNITNFGWCPPNFTSLEKMLLGWMEPIELTEATSIRDLKSIDNQGETYIVHQDGAPNHYLLIENRQLTGWDAGLPGQGLVIWDVHYDAAKWSNNRVNDNSSSIHFTLVYADGRDYAAWHQIVVEMGKTSSPWQHSYRMNNYHLSTSPFPYTEAGDDPVVHDSYTFDGKPITQIAISSEGLASFDFMGGLPTGIREMQASGFRPQEYYDLQGRRVDAPVRGQLYIVRQSDGRTRKYIY